MNEQDVRETAYVAGAVVIVAVAALLVSCVVWLIFVLWNGSDSGSPADLPRGCVRGHSEYHGGTVRGLCDEQRPTP